MSTKNDRHKNDGWNIVESGIKHHKAKLLLKNGVQIVIMSVKNVLSSKRQIKFVSISSTCPQQLKTSLKSFN